MEQGDTSMSAQGLGEADCFPELPAISKTFTTSYSDLCKDHELHFKAWS